MLVLNKTLSLLGLMLVSLSLVSGARAIKPNIVFFLADDMTYADAGFMDHADVETPHLDKLASEGMVLTHTFTVVPMCSPTRHAIYTGLFPVSNGGYPNHAKARDGVKSVVHYLDDLGYRVGLAGKSHIWPESVYPFVRVGGRRLDWNAISDFMNQDDNEPFCLIIASSEPHTPWDQGESSFYDADALTLPSYLVDTPETRVALTKYYAEVTYTDSQVGATVRLLKESGKSGNTLFMFSTEQGSTAPYAKWTLYDAGIRGAMVVRWPGRIQPGSRSDALVQYTDILPTWIDAAGGDSIPAIEGRSFLALLEGDVASHQKYVYALQTTVGINFARHAYPIRGIRNDRYKLIWNMNHAKPFTNTITEADRCEYFESWRKQAREDDIAAAAVDNYQHRPEFEFYDLQTDPEERNNLIKDYSGTSEVTSLKRELEKWMRSQGDNGMQIELDAPNRQVRPRPLSQTSRDLAR